MVHGPSPRPVGRPLALPVLASITALTAPGGDAEAGQRRATLGVSVQVTGNCQATTRAAAAVAEVDATCAASARPATLIESGPAPARTGVAGITGAQGTAVLGAKGGAVPLTGAVEEDGIQYLSVIY